MTTGGATLKDLAALLDVSVATVSRALAGNPRISADTRKRVLKAAREAGYVPNRAAQTLVSGRSSGFVGLVLTDPGYGREDSYLGDFISGLGAGLGEHGIDLFLAAIPQGQSELSVITNIVTSRRADGLVLGRTSEIDPRVDYLTSVRFPFVTHGRVLDEATSFSWLDTDGTGAFAEAFDRLYDLGHRRFGLITIEEPLTFRGHRAEGIAQAMTRRGDPSVTLQVATSPRYDHALREARIRELLGRPDRPTAILCIFDGLALSVMRQAEALGLDVPGDLSVVGFDNIPSASLARPGLTTFDSDTVNSARDIARMLVRALADPEGEPETRLTAPRLILRGSHGPAPGE